MCYCNNQHAFRFCNNCNPMVLIPRIKELEEELRQCGPNSEWALGLQQQLAERDAKISAAEEEIIEQINDMCVVHWVAMIQPGEDLRHVIGRIINQCTAEALDPRISREAQALVDRGKADGRTPCVWTYDPHQYMYDASCGTNYAFNDGTAEDNQVKFCHACGGPVTFIYPDFQDDDRHE